MEMNRKDMATNRNDTFLYSTEEDGIAHYEVLAQKDQMDVQKRSHKPCMYVARTENSQTRGSTYNKDQTIMASIIYVAYHIPRSMQLSKSTRLEKR